LEKDRYARASAVPSAKAPVSSRLASFHRAASEALLRAHAYLRQPGVVPALIILLWACAVLPNLTVRSFIYEEGTNAEMARDILAHGHFLNLSVYGVRWHVTVERPPLLDWLIAAIAFIIGGVNEWSARLPAMLSVLATALLVHRVARRYASPAAALFAALSFLFCPLLLQKLTVAEPDTLVTVLSFAALVVWWDGEALGRVTFWRWGACGLLLAALALTKGPQPAAFFALGVAAYLFVERKWRDLPGLFLCMIIPAAVFLAWAATIYRPGDQGAWLSYARLEYHPALRDYLWRIVYSIGSLFLELLPASLLLPFVPWPWRRRKGDVPAVVAPMVLYSSVCTIILFLWPGVNTRYAMPIAPSVAVLAGIAWNALGNSPYAVMRRVTAIAAALLATYQIVLVVFIMPLFADRFGETRLAGEAIGRAVRAAPAPAYCLHLDTNMLFYANVPVHCSEIEGLAALTPPAWLLIPAPYLSDLARLRPDFKLTIVAGPLTEAELTATRLEKK
jgi:4-amino-4-deoxy-L-arabinose transferase-like glycosyltransferase